MPASGGSDVFIHIKALNNGNRRPTVGQMVSHTRSVDKQGRPRAVRATLTGEKPQPNGGRHRGTGSIVLALMFLALVVIVVLAGKLPVAVLAISASAW